MWVTGSSYNARAAPVERAIYFAPRIVAHQRLTVNWYRDLFRIESGRISTLLFVRVAIAVGVPLFGFVLLGRLWAAVAAGATAMFVTMSDIGVTRAGRIGTMACATLIILLGGVTGV